MDPKPRPQSWIQPWSGPSLFFVFTSQFPPQNCHGKMKAVAWCTLNHLEHLIPGARIPSTPRCISICRSSCSRFRRSSFLRSLQKKSVLFFFIRPTKLRKEWRCAATELLHFKLTLQLPLLLQELEVSLLRTSQKVHGTNWMGSVPNSWDRSNWNCRGWEPAGPPKENVWHRKLRPLGPTNFSFTLQFTSHLTQRGAWQEIRYVNSMETSETPALERSKVPCKKNHYSLSVHSSSMLFISWQAIFHPTSSPSRCLSMASKGSWLCKLCVKEAPELLQI